MTAEPETRSVVPPETGRNTHQPPEVIPPVPRCWLNLPDDPTDFKHAETTVKALTAFLARTVSQEQSFDSVNQFFKVAKAGTMLSHPGDWLPPSLLTSALARAEETGAWSLRAKGPPDRAPARKKIEALELICVLENGTTLVGRFRLRGDRVQSVSVNTC